MNVTAFKEGDTVQVFIRDDKKKMSLAVLGKVKSLTTTGAFLVHHKVTDNPFSEWFPFVSENVELRKQVKL